MPHLAYWILGTMTYLVFGNYIGRVKYRVYHNQYKEFTKWEEFKRRVFFPEYGYKRGWDALKDWTFTADSLKHDLDTYLAISTFLWPFIHVFSVGGIIRRIFTRLCNFVNKVTRFVIWFIALFNHLPNMLSSIAKQSHLNIRFTFKILLAVTWGGGVALSPLWTYLFGWQVGAMVVAGAWGGWHFGRKAFIKYFQRHGAEIQNLRAFSKQQLGSYEGSLNAGLKEWEQKIKTLEDAIKEGNKTFSASSINTPYNRALMDALKRRCDTARSKHLAIEKDLSILAVEMDKLNERLGTLEFYRRVQSLVEEDFGARMAHSNVLSEAQEIVRALQEKIHAAQHTSLVQMDIPAEPLAEHTLEGWDRDQENLRQQAEQAARLDTVQPTDASASQLKKISVC